MRKNKKQANHTAGVHYHTDNVTGADEADWFPEPVDPEDQGPSGDAPDVGPSGSGPAPRDDDDDSFVQKSRKMRKVHMHKMIKQANHTAGVHYHTDSNGNDVADWFPSSGSAPKPSTGNPNGDDDDDDNDHDNDDDDDSDDNDDSSDDDDSFLQKKSRKMRKN